MEKFAQGALNHRKGIIAVFLISVMLCIFLSTRVSVNYDMVDYLPEDAQSTTAIELMEEFGGEIPNARIMLTNVSIYEVLEYKEKIKAIDGVTSVTWLDDIIGLETLKSVPLEFMDKPMLESYYKDNNALLSVSIKGGKEIITMSAIYELIGGNNAASGEAVSAAETQAMSVSEAGKALAILLPIIIIILIISTDSWIEPLLFLFSIGVAIAINMGTNIIFGEISFITNTVSPILQLAVSLDYAIFLLHSFNEHRKTNEPRSAMLLAMKEAFSTIAASAATTVIGFSALIFMRFSIGADLGLNLLKGVTLSFISVIVFLPAITLLSYNIIDKTRHRRLMPEFKKSGKWLMKVRMPFLLIALLIVVPAYLAQSNTQFVYGTESIASASRVGKDTAFIKEHFGNENILVLLVPKEDPGKELQLCSDLADISHVTDVVSFVTSVGSSIPHEFVPAEALEQFYSDNYARIILYTDTDKEGPEAFDTVQAVLNTASEHYDTYYLAGESATLYDMKNVVSVDNRRINLIAIAGILLTLFVTFRSLVLPLFLLFTIETAIWINLSIPYFIGKPLSFVGFLIISTVQLGATVDYAILITNTYLRNRMALPRKEAMSETLGNNLISVLISAGILSTAGFALAYTSSNPVISDLGLLLGRGTLLSLAMVVFVLPALLVLFDGVIQKTTFKNNVSN